MFVQITATEMKKWKGQKDWEYQLSFSDPAYKDISTGLGLTHYHL